MAHTPRNCPTCQPHGQHIVDATAIQEHSARLRGAIDDDLALAISQAKALIEATWSLNASVHGLAVSYGVRLSISW